MRRGGRWEAESASRGSHGFQGRSSWLEPEPPCYENYTRFFPRQAGALAARDPDKPRLESLGWLESGIEEVGGHSWKGGGVGREVRGTA